MPRALPPSTLSRRSFLGRATTAAALAAGPAANILGAQATGDSFDLIVAGGTVIDPYNETNKIADVGIKAGKIDILSET